MKKRINALRNLAVFIFLICCCARSAQGANAWPDEKKPARFPKPEPAQLQDFERASCVSLDSATRICHGLTDKNPSGSSFVIEKNGQRLSEWEGAAFMGETARFQALKADLDADGKNELVIINSDSVSNGVAINFWSVAILPFPVTDEKQTPLLFHTEDLGAEGFLVPNKTEKGYDLLVTEWEWLPLRKGSEREAFFLLGRWMRYKNNSLVPMSRPILARRYLSSFEKVRLDTLEKDDIPLSWLSSAATEHRGSDPVVSFPVKSTVNGIVESVSAEQRAQDGEENSSLFAIKIKTTGGENLTFSYSSDSDETAKNSFVQIGDYSKRRLFPQGYLPPGIDKWLVNKTVKIIAYALPYDRGDRLILWITN